jgi:hypothetical protein
MISKKEQIIQELTTKNILDCQTMQDGDFWGDLSDEEKLEVDNAIFENIKQNSEGWTIKENVLTFRFYMGKGVWYERLRIEWLGKVLGSSRGYCLKYETLLVHELFPMEYDEEGIIWDYRHLQPFDSFTEEQKTELRKLLNPTIADLADSQLGEMIEPPRNFSFPPSCQILSIAIVLAVLVFH